MTAPRVAICGWIGSTNLGDELIADSVAGLIDDAGARPTLVTIDPDRHPAGTSTIRHAKARDTLRLAHQLAGHDGLVFGGGGLIQDETGPLNLPFHLTRLAVGRILQRPWIGLGLGVGEVRRRSGRALVRAFFRGAVAVTVRDAGSADRLASLTGRRPQLGIDPVLARPSVSATSKPELVVSLRPINDHKQRRLADNAAPDPATVARWAAAIDQIATEQQLSVRFVSWDDSFDHAIHQRVAGELAHPATLDRPQDARVVEAMGTGRLVLTMRYHGAVSALLTGRPAVVLDYSPKMADLVEEVGSVLQLTAPTAAPSVIAAAAAEAAATTADPAARVRFPAERAAANREAVVALLTQIRG